MLSTKISAWTVALLSALVAIAFLKPLVGLPLQIPKDYNEGWNAYHSERIFGDEPLYPPADAFISNNYPPLWFYIVGGVNLVVGDSIITGRLIALVGLLSVAFWISIILLSFDAHRFVALCTSLLFLAFIGAYDPSYVAMNGPQWFAHAVMMAGLALLIRRPDHAGSIVGAAALMVTAGFVKHNPVSLPIAVTIWIISFGWRPFLLWTGASVSFLLCAFGALYGIHGPNALVGILDYPRSYSVERAVRNGSLDILPSSVFVAAGVLLAFIEPRDRATRLAWLYLLIAGASGYLAVGGAGASYNYLYDFAIASTLAAGLAIDRIGRRIKAVASSEQAVQAAGILALSIAILFRLPVVCLDTAVFFKNLSGQMADAKADIALLESQSGPVACEMLALCYWAGKPFEIDFFGTQQKLLARGEFPESFLRYVEQRQFAAIQLAAGGGRYSYHLPDEAVQQLLRNYRIERRSPASIILVRMAGLRSGFSSPQSSGTP
jgi:hypothetical protein